MKILLIGNYLNSRSQSMHRFAEMMRQGIEDAGHEVRVLRPCRVLGRLVRSDEGIGKWIGYVDRFVIFPPQLRRDVQWADVVHICDQANAVYLPHLRGKPNVLTCHDVLAIRAALGEISQSPTRLTGRIYQRWILRNLREARAVACVSSQTRDDVRRLTNLSEDCLTIIPNGLNYPYRPMLAGEAQGHLRALGLNPPSPFFMHVGGNQWYKNRAAAIRIFAELVKYPAYRQHFLLMAGKPWTAEMRALAERLCMPGRVMELGEVSNEELRALYSSAEALLFPSLQEGFGWPIAEAQASGCVVATTNRPPMTEVGGPAAIYIDPEEPAKAAQAIAAGLVEQQGRKEAGLENASRFSAASMMEGYLHIYRKVLQRISFDRATDLQASARVRDGQSG